MGDLNIIDKFTETFTRFIESGFGLLQGDVAFLTTVLVGIDIALAGLLWALSDNENVPAQLIKKVLIVGFFALLLNNFSALADIVFQSFAGLGLRATGTSLTSADLLRPGFIAETGFQASKPLLEKAGELIGFTTFFQNFVTIAVLLLAWVIVLLAFFILSVQLFITIIEFKLTTLAGFVLVPFALFGRTAFLAERVLGNVISSGIKLMVLAIVIGIGATLFGEIATPTGDEINLNQAASIILAAVAVFGLAIFVPGIAAGLVTGAPQLGAGAAVGTTVGLGAVGVGGVVAGSMATRAAASAGSTAVQAGASLAGRTSAAYSAGGVAGVAKTAIAEPAKRAAAAVSAPVSNAYREGAAQGIRDASPSQGGGTSAASSPPANGPPAWAQNLQRQQQLRGAGFVAAQSIREGDRPSGSSGPSLNDK